MTALPTRPLGASQLKTSVIGLGCNNFGGRLDLEATTAVVDAALEGGVSFFDTADIYGRHGNGASAPGPGRSEELLGQALKGRRDQVVLATKFGMDMGDGAGAARGSATYVHAAIDASLRRLSTDSVDLYWYHRPDGVTPILETLTALHELVIAGKVRAIGASNFSAAQLREAAAVAAEHDLTPFTALQNEYSLLHREPESDGTLAACEELNVGFVPFFPLASGLLTGKYRRDGDRPVGARLSQRDSLASEAEWNVIDGLNAFASKRDLTMTQVAIGALLVRPVVSSVIAGATRPEQIGLNRAAVTWRPSSADLRELVELVAAS
jgi:aryl-alcohol dehydrogenase-like predicted oxidoreductase